MVCDSHDHVAYTRRYSASNSSVSEHITLGSDLRSMIMNYRGIITEFASCSGLKIQMKERPKSNK